MGGEKLRARMADIVANPGQCQFCEHDAAEVLEFLASHDALEKERDELRALIKATASQLRGEASRGLWSSGVVYAVEQFEACILEE